LPWHRLYIHTMENLLRNDAITQDTWPIGIGRLVSMPCTAACVDSWLETYLFRLLRLPWHQTLSYFQFWSCYWTWCISNASTILSSLMAMAHSGSLIRAYPTVHHIQRNYTLRVCTINLDSRWFSIILILRFDAISRLNKQEFFLGFSMPLRKRQTRLRPRKNISNSSRTLPEISRPFKLIWTVSALKDCTMLHIWYNSTGACFDEQPTYFATEPWRWHGERFALTQRYLSHSTIRCILLTENRAFRSYLFLLHTQIDRVWAAWQGPWSP